MSKDLQQLRDEIAEIDRALLELVRRRLDVAAEVGRQKASAGVPVVVRDVEDRCSRGRGSTPSGAACRATPWRRSSRPSSAVPSSGSTGSASHCAPSMAAAS